MKVMKRSSSTFLAAAVAAALFVSSSAMAQVKIGTNPTVIGANNNLEVEASTTGRKTSVDKATGQVTIADGTQGTGKIFTSDANGGGSWQSTTTLRIPETVWIGEQSGTYTITPFIPNDFDDVKDRIPLVARSGSIAGYNPTTKQYTIQQDGYYRIHVGAKITATTPGPLPNFVRLYLGNFGVLQQFNNFAIPEGPVLSTFWEAFMPAGTTFDIYVISSTNNGITQNAIVSNAFMSVTKLF